uniref:Uncharacterized protein n=1 Tax=Oryza punctata TaxID=4537 RepID=A0A0E0LBW3_ORYPU
MNWWCHLWLRRCPPHPCCPAPPSPTTHDLSPPPATSSSTSLYGSGGASHRSGGTHHRHDLPPAIASAPPPVAATTDAATPSSPTSITWPRSGGARCGSILYPVTGFLLPRLHLPPCARLNTGVAPADSTLGSACAGSEGRCIHQGSLRLPPPSSPLLRPNKRLPFWGHLRLSIARRSDLALLCWPLATSALPSYGFVIFLHDCLNRVTVLLCNVSSRTLVHGVIPHARDHSTAPLARLVAWLPRH